MTFVRTSANPAANDDIGKIDFFANDNAGNSDRFALMRAQIVDTTGGSEDGRLIFSTVVAGSNVDTVKIEAGNLKMADSRKAIFGTGDDLQIYHDGSHSYISDQGTGNLRILTSNFEVENAANNESMIGALADGSVKLYHNNVLKIETTAAGANVTGVLDVSTDIDVGDDILLSSDNAAITFGADADFSIKQVGVHELSIKSNSTSDDTYPALFLDTGETDIAANDVLGMIHFRAPDEGTGTDAILPGASIVAKSEGNFAADNNATKLEFRTAASETATTKLTLTSDGRLVSSATAKAWISFNAQGSAAIKDSHNVSSLGDQAVGWFYANIDVNLPNSNAAAVGSGSNSNNTYRILIDTAVQIVGSWYIMCSGHSTSNSVAAFDPELVYSVVFGND